MKVVRSLCLLFFLLASLAEAKKNSDLYKVLGVDRTASQRDIQKAFHKLSLQYHPDKNKSKGAQEKFAEINNAYDILSDEEKRKNYDLYGDEKVGGFDGGANFGGGNYGGHEGFSYFTSGGPGGSQFNFKPGGFQGKGGQGNSFSFSFGGNPGGGSPFGFGDIFSNFFGGQARGGQHFGGFSGSSGSSSGHTSFANLQSVNAQVYKKEILEQGMTWLLLFYTPSRGIDMMESIVEDVSNSLLGAIKAGSINCQNERALCNDLGVRISTSARIFIYSYSSGGVSLIEYDDELDSRSLRSFCIEFLPRFSKRVNIRDFEFPVNRANLPQVLLLSTKRDTPVIWRALSGLYRNRFVFYDAEVQNNADKKLKNLGVDALPSLVGRLVSGDIHVIKSGISKKDLKTDLSELRALLDNFEKKNNKAAQQSPNDDGKGIPHLTSLNMNNLCGDKTTLCIIGAYRSSKGKDKIESILSVVSQMTLTRRQNLVQSTGDAVRYAILDANKQSSFLKSFDKSGFRKSDLLVLAYKPRKTKFAAYSDDRAITLEEVERFIGSVLNGDIRFSKLQQKPVIK